ncbi:hypothetical protein D9M68_934370 [compost metagenome]
MEGAPEFSHSAHAVYAPQRENETLARVRAGLRLVAAAEEGRRDSGVHLPD